TTLTDRTQRKIEVPYREGPVTLRVPKVAATRRYAPAGPAHVAATRRDVPAGRAHVAATA
ncbi:hypothetical protein ABZ837_11250, partial [Streptomyces sp. NPDC047197]|uniref:hypothetical protein n=1 Tax=Streptomyces sp. NPDC047197 TaxID=3155477 RepID=UPI0033FE3794